MNSLYGVKRFIGRRVLNRLLKKNSKRFVKTCNINEAKSFGIICTIKDQSDYNRMVKMVDFLRFEFSIPEIRALAYFPSKEDPFYLKSRLGLDFFKMTDLNFFAFPNNVPVRNFINEEFDILLDITREHVVPLRFILHYSKSTFKVGNYSNHNENYYDMMIDIDISEYEEYIDQVVNYLKMLNNPIIEKEQLSN